MKEEVESLSQKITMMRDVIQTQQSYARSSYHTEEFDIYTIVDDALDVQESSLMRHEVQVTKFIPDNLPLCKGQRSKLLQVVTNIIKNAVEAMHDNDALGKSKQLVIEVVADNEQMAVKVIDNGDGIRKEHIDSVFNHGFTTKEDGHGFGLHTSVNAMTEMQGQLVVESQGEALGTTFTIHIPVACADTELSKNADIHETNEKNVKAVS